MKPAFLAAALLLLTTTTRAQNDLPPLLQAVSVSATTQAFGVPFTNYLPLHPGVEVKAPLGGATTYTHSTRYWRASLGFFHHAKVSTAVYGGLEHQFTYTLLEDKVHFDVPLGFGYLHSWYPGELYEQNDNGDFERVGQFGRPHLYGTAGIGFTFMPEANVSPFIRQDLMVQTPFANSIPVMIHSFLKVGVHLTLPSRDDESK